MKNLNIAFLMFSISTGILFGAEAPPAAPQSAPKQHTSYIELLPRELQFKTSLYALLNNDILNIPALANLIRTQGRNAIAPKDLIDIFESLPTYSAALYLAETLQDLPILKNQDVASWIDEAKKQLINGQPLFDAIAKGSLETTKNLTNNKYSNLNWRSTQTARGGGLVPLLRAVSLSLNAQKEEEVVRLLLKAGANSNLASLTKDRQGNTDRWTALMAVSGKGHSQTVALLLQAGADPNIQDNVGDTALVEAARAGHADVVDLLLKAGANPAIKNNEGKTARDLTNHPVIQELLDAAMPRKK